MSSVVSGHYFRASENNFHISLNIMPEKCGRVRGPSGLNSHIRRGSRWHERIRQISITWITLVRPMYFLMRLRMRLCSIFTSSTDPHSSPLSIHDASCNGGPNQNVGVAAHLLPQGSVMYNHSRCHRSEVSMKEPFGQVVLTSLLTAAPPHSASFPLTTFGFT